MEQNLQDLTRRQVVGTTANSLRPYQQDSQKDRGLTRNYCWAVRLLGEVWMQDIRIDSNGDLRCWNCGGKNFLGKRTGRAHIIGFATLGVGALATKKKLKCQVCNQYNQVGKAKEFNDPLGREYQKERLAEQDDANPTFSCSVCGADVPIDSKFCSACGSKFDSDPTCPSCGTLTQSEAQFCHECGAAQRPGPGSPGSRSVFE